MEQKRDSEAKFFKDKRTHSVHSCSWNHSFIRESRRLLRCFYNLCLPPWNTITSVVYQCTQTYSTEQTRTDIQKYKHRYIFIGYHTISYTHALSYKHINYLEIICQEREICHYRSLPDMMSLSSNEVSLNATHANTEIFHHLNGTVLYRFIWKTLFELVLISVDVRHHGECESICFWV